jgi:hypothetical protein
MLRHLNPERVVERRWVGHPELNQWNARARYKVVQIRGVSVKNLKIALLLSEVVLGLSCRLTPDPRLAELEKKVSDLQQTQEGFKFDIEFLKNRAESLTALDQQSQPHSATFSPSEKGLQIIHYDSGYLLVSLQDVKPYANGYKATFHFGNPLQVTLAGADVELKWGPKRQKDMKITDWAARFRSAKQSLTQNLLPGSWNPVEVILVPASPDDVGQIEITTITTKTVRLVNR